MKLSTQGFQFLVYTLGFFLIATSFVEFLYGNEIQADISEYEEKVENYKQIREDLRLIHNLYSEISMDYTALDFDCYGSTTNGYFNDTEAFIRLSAFVVHFSEAFLEFERLILQQYNNPDYDIQWIFTENIMCIHWFGEDNVTIMNAFNTAFGVTNMEEWCGIIVPSSEDFYFYSLSYGILKSWLGNMPYLVVVFFWDFDQYVNENYVEPLLLLESQNSLLNSMVSLTTIGILVLGFVMNFGDVNKFWKIIYILLALLSSYLAIKSTIELILEVLI
ncbi:MAG: hypothetical protein ACTSWY_02315 [Promethearchaeota archaeon]